MNRDEYMARNANLIEYLESHGYTLKKSGREFRLTQPDSITVRDNKWYRHSHNVGGGPLEFLTLVEGHTKDEAVKMLSGIEPFAARKPLHQSEADTEEKMPFVLPEAAPRASRVYAYLVHSRGIDSELVRIIMHKKDLYESKKYHNCVFVGRDNNGEAKYACMRGTNTFAKEPFRMDVAGSDKSYGFCIQGTGSRLCVFESAIDALSHATLAKIRQNQDISLTKHWTYDHRLLLGCVSEQALERYAKEHSEVKTISFCLDNDPAGIEAMLRCTEKYQGMGYTIECELPDNKDWNDDLMAFRNSQTQGTGEKIEMEDGIEL